MHCLEVCHGDTIVARHITLNPLPSNTPLSLYSLASEDLSSNGTGIPATEIILNAMSGWSLLGPTSAVITDLQVTGMNAQAFVDALERDHGVQMGSGYFGGTKVRAMTHLNIGREDVERALEASRAVLDTHGR